jgi:hypothetical protein
MNGNRALFYGSALIFGVPRRGGLHACTPDARASPAKKQGQNDPVAQRPAFAMNEGTSAWESPPIP